MLVLLDSGGLFELQYFGRVPLKEPTLIIDNCVKAGLLNLIGQNRYIE
jgi:hypothetical protein